MSFKEDLEKYKENLEVKTVSGCQGCVERGFDSGVKKTAELILKEMDKFCNGENVLGVLAVAAFDAGELREHIKSYIEGEK